MFRLFRLMIYFIVIAGLIILFIMWNGGEKIRWFGKKTEEAGKTIKKKSEILGDKSDQLKDKIEDKKESIEETINTVVETAEKHGIIKKDGEVKKK